MSASRLRLEAPGFLPAEADVPSAGEGPVSVRMKAKGSVTASFLSPDEKREESVVVTLSGRGDKDVQMVAKVLGEDIE